MTNNYPRDEFDRVPEFNTRVGSHHAHGWAQSAASKGTGGKLRWVVLAAIAVVVIGALAYFFGPRDLVSVAGSPSNTETSAPVPSESTDESASPSEDASESASPSSTIDDADVLYGQLIGVYNGANIAGIASAGQEALTEAGFTNVATGDWTKPADKTTVYFTSEAYRFTAMKVAELIGVDEIYITPNIPNRVTVVMGKDDPLGVK